MSPGGDPPPAAVPAAPAGPAGPRAEARELVTKAWEQLNRTELYRTELEIADGLLKRAAELAQDDPDVWAAWAHVDAWNVYHSFDLSSERREAARQKAARALRLDARSFEARLADACYIVRATGAQPGAGRGGDALPAAERTLRDLVRERPDDHRPRFALGILLRNARRYEEGVAEFERMALLPGRAATAWSEIGWLHQFAGDSQRAVEAADRSIAAHPFFGNLLLRLQLARYWTGDLELAKSAAAQMPPSLRTEDIIAAATFELFRWRREPAEMLRILDTVPRGWIATQPFNGPKFFLVAQAHRMAGREDAAQLAWREALRLIEQRLEKEPDSAALLTLKARTFWALGWQTEARQAARLAESFGAVDNLDLLLELGEFDRALTTLEELMAAPTSDVSGPTRWAELKLNPRFDPVRADPRHGRINVLVGTKKQPAEAIKAHQVMLNGADGLEFPTLLNCALVYQVRKAAILRAAGAVPMPAAARLPRGSGWRWDWAEFLHLAGLVDFLAFNRRQIPPMVLVGIVNHRAEDARRTELASAK